MVKSVFKQISNNSYKLWSEPELDKVRLTMQMHTDLTNTRQIPQIETFLEQNLPDIFNCNCFNDHKRSFREEVKETQIAHLFEHILLEYLFSIQLINNQTKKNYRGVTKWDWRSEPVGRFNIFIDLDSEDYANFDLALEKTNQLFDKILAYHNNGKAELQRNPAFRAN